MKKIISVNVGGICSTMEIDAYPLKYHQYFLQKFISLNYLLLSILQKVGLKTSKKIQKFFIFDATFLRFIRYYIVAMFQRQ